MTSFRCNLSRFLAIVMLAGGLMTGSPAAVSAEPEKPDVLILHSFHKGQKWNDDLSRGIVDGVGDHVVLHFEYMDAMRFFDEPHLANLYRLYAHKYETRPVDLIIATDESALDFLLTFRDELFPDVPVVFCGIKYLDENKLYGEANLTGVIEQVDIERNVQLILQLQRGIRRIVVVTDNSPTSISTIRRFVPVLKQYRDQIDFHFTEAMHSDQLRRFLSRLTPDQAVILVRHTQDIDGRVFTMEESALAVTESCPVPVYAFWDHYLGNGILGGLLVSGHAQGKIAAGIALEILQGKRIDEIPVQEGTAGLFMFDARLLKKHQIPEHRLPADRIVIHQPLSFYNQYQRLILTVLAGIIGLSLIIVILSINIIRRRRVEKSLKKTSHRLALMREIDHAILNAFSIEFVAEKLMEPIQHIFAQSTSTTRNRTAQHVRPYHRRPGKRTEAPQRRTPR